MVRDERAVREQVIEELEVDELFLRELGEVGLDVLVQRDELRARPYLSSPGTLGAVELDDLL